MKKLVINCTHCGGALDQSLFLQQMEQGLREKMEADLKEKLKEQEVKLKARIKKELDAEASEERALLKEELEDKTARLKELNKTKAEVEKLKREKDSAEDEAKLKMQQELSIKLAEEKQKMTKVIEQQSSLRIIELQKQLEDQKKLTDQMKRKQDQGSVQLQGEAQEILIEEFLRKRFPHDEILEIKKGVKGADCLQIIQTAKGKCGSIYYESKRTKTFERSWIQKFKTDMREKGAQFGILISEARPSGIDRMTQIDGVWVVSFNEFQDLCGVLREATIKLNEAVCAQVNRGDKKELMYDFVTSELFRGYLSSIVEAFSQMQSDLNSEMRAIEGLWKKRTKNIEIIIDSTIGLYGNIMAISDNSFKPIIALELEKPEPENV